eukprot:2044872-Lingulodinium_polyedra.AAC.1
MGSPFSPGRRLNRRRSQAVSYIEAGWWQRAFPGQASTLCWWSPPTAAQDARFRFGGCARRGRGF